MAKHQQKRTHLRFNWKRGALLGGILGIILMLAAGISVIVSAINQMPPLDMLAVKPELTSLLFDAQGKEIGPIPAGKNRILVTLNDVPVDVQQAFVAIEDQRFYEHHGIDVTGILRAGFADLMGRRLQGGSTITQQLARNAFPIGSARTLSRKVKEAIIAIELERRYTKDEILTMYLNQVFFGHNAYGIEAASQTYFRTDSKNLTPWQGALLAAMVNAPSALDPYLHATAARDRRNLVLDKMAELKYITPEQAAIYKQKPLDVKPVQNLTQTYKYPWFTDYVIEQLKALGFTDKQIYTGGLRIYTTLEPKAQAAAEAAVPSVLDQLGKTLNPIFQKDRKPTVQGAVVVLDQSNGHIVAMVGGREHTAMLELNRAVDALHQPGSAMKPLAVYTPALAMGFSPGTVVDDAPVAYPNGIGGSYIPRNDDNTYYGLTTVREAVMRSVNAVAVNVLMQISPQTGWEYAQKLGLDTLVPADRVPALALGGITRGVSPLQMARAYATIANGGVRVDPIAITKVTDSRGNVLKEIRSERKQVVSPQVAYEMADILHSVVSPDPNQGGFIANWGTGMPVGAIPATGGASGSWWTAGKTGTTTGSKALWFVGFTPKYTAAAWVGYDQEREMPSNAFGGTTAGLIFKETMTGALAGIQPFDLPRPDGLVTAVIDTKSGKLPSPLTPDRWKRSELFTQQNVPTEISNAWVQQEVDANNPDWLWDSNCPDPPQTKVFLNRKPYTLDDAKKLAEISNATVPAQDRLPPERFIPRDMSLAAPTTTCSQALGQTAGTSGNNQVIPTEVTIHMAATGDNPVYFKAKVGQPVNLTLVSDDNKEHIFSVADWNLHVTVPAGKSVTVTLTPTKDGAFLFRCTEPGHVGEIGRIFVSR